MCSNSTFREHEDHGTGCCTGTVSVIKEVIVEAKIKTSVPPMRTEQVSSDRGRLVQKKHSGPSAKRELEPELTSATKGMTLYCSAFEVIVSQTCNGKNPIYLGES